jgi:hypothetical protein
MDTEKISLTLFNSKKQETEESVLKNKTNGNRNRKDVKEMKRVEG